MEEPVNRRPSKNFRKDERENRTLKIGVRYKTIVQNEWTYVYFYTSTGHKTYLDSFRCIGQKERKRENIKFLTTPPANKTKQKQNEGTVQTFFEEFRS